MKINDYLKIQKEFLKYIENDKDINQYFLGIIHSSSEMSHNLLEVNYKFNDNTIYDFNKYRYLVDIFKYFLCICNYYDIDIKKFNEYFKFMSMFVKDRYNLKKIIDRQYKNNKIALIDIDGTLAVFPEYFIKLFNKKYDTNYKFYNDIPIKARNIFKEYYRISGYKAKMPLYKYVKEFLNKLHNKGYTIVLFTNRPAVSYPNITIDTIKWVFNNKLKYDTILYSNDKMLDAIKKFDIKDIKFFVDDNFDNVLSISKLGVKSYLIKNQLTNIKNDISSINIIDNLNQINLEE